MTLDELADQIAGLRISDRILLRDLTRNRQNGDHDRPHDDDKPSITVDGATFLLDDNIEIAARWGTHTEILWAKGESLLVVGPPGVGKTTIAGQIVGALTGCWTTVLGYPMAPARRVLLLAMDRPRQVQRALRRSFGPEHRQYLADHLVVRKGPLPADLGKNPGLLLELAQINDCDVIIIDSLKDAAVKITDDEVGGNVNRAIQMCNAHDIDVLALHHQRKGQGGDKPTSLEDVYGSTWITAGAGSVILLWGEAGSELVELTHLKQPSDPVGPFTVEHDHHAGTSHIAHGFNVLAYLNMKGDKGATVDEASQAEHGAPQKSGEKKWKKTERRLRGLVQSGLATLEPRQRGTDGTFEPGRFYALDNPYGQDLFDTFMDDTTADTVDNNGHFQDSPVHTMNTSMDTSKAPVTVDKVGGVNPPTVQTPTYDSPFD